MPLGVHDSKVTHMTSLNELDSIPWLTDEEQEVWRNLLKSWIVVMEALDRDMGAFGLTLADYEVLVHLSEADDRQLRMAELADHALMSRSRLTYRVDRLVRKGLVDRRPCETDRRGAFAVITDAGIELLKRAAPIHVLGVRRYLFSSSDSTGWKFAGEASRAMVEACDSTDVYDLAAMVARDDRVITVR